MGKTEKRIGQLLCVADTFLAVASVQFSPVKVYRVAPHDHLYRQSLAVLEAASEAVRVFL
jgi:predicted metal-dependent enzyme (double-stranded beta helix superfamily)